MRYRLVLEEKEDIGIDFSQVKNISWDKNGETLTYEVIHDGTDGFNECFVNRIETQKIPEDKRMKNKIFNVLFWICVALFVISAGYLTIQCFIQIDMTKMRFSITYWKEELIMAVSVIFGIYLSDRR